MAMNPPLSVSTGEVPPVLGGRDRSPIKSDDQKSDDNSNNKISAPLSKSNENKVRKIVSNINGNKKNKKKKSS